MFIFLYGNLDGFSSKIAMFYEFYIELSLSLLMSYCMLHCLLVMPFSFRTDFMNFILNSLLIGEALHYALCSLRRRRLALPRTPSRYF